MDDMQMLFSCLDEQETEQLLKDIDIPADPALSSSIKNRLNSNNSESILYGEVWEDASNKISYNKKKKYYCGNELDGVMNYPIKEGIISYLRYNDTGKLRYALSDIIFNAPTRIRNLQMNLAEKVRKEKQTSIY